MVDHLLAHRAQQQGGEPPAPATADHDQVSPPGLLEENGGGAAFDHYAFGSNLGLQLFSAGDRLTDDAFSLLARVLDHLRGIEAHGFNHRGHLPSRYDTETSPPKSGFLDRKLESRFRMFGTVDANYDGLHLTSILSWVVVRTITWSRPLEATRSPLWQYQRLPSPTRTRVTRGQDSPPMTAPDPYPGIRKSATCG